MVIGVRELSRNVSRVLDTVADGEEVVVTWHGKPVAKIVPYEQSAKDGVFEQLVERGVITPAQRTGRMPPPQPVQLTEGTVGELLDE